MQGMKLYIEHQQLYSRAELLLRTIFGSIYIFVPHVFLLFFIGIWSGILGIITVWVVLFTGEFPESFFEFQVKLMNWQLRLNASMTHLIDGYPAFGINGTSDKVKLDVVRPERLSRGLVLIRLFFASAYVGVPHGFCLFFRFIASSFISVLAWWAVLFTGNYPESWHEFNVGTQRWMIRVRLYTGLFTDDYPPFSGKE